MPKVSIILPSYNHERFLQKRLDSILNQSFQDWELIIIDDCSTDGSVKILNAFVEKHKHKVANFILNETNSGSGYKSWEKGIALAQSEYIWIAETDDYCDTNFLNELVEVLDKDQDVQIAFTSSNYIDEHDSFLYDSRKRTEKLNVEEEAYRVFDSNVILKELPLNPYLINASALVFRNPKQKVDESIFSFMQKSDQFLWTVIAQNKSVCFLNKKLNYFRQHGQSTTSKNFNTKQIEVFRQNIAYCNYFNLGNEKLISMLKGYIRLIFQNKIYSNVLIPKQIFNLEGVSKLKIIVVYKVLLFQYVLRYLKRKIIR